MKVYLKLVNALIKTVEPSNGEKKKHKKVFYIIMSIIAVFGIMIPIAFFVGFIIYVLTSSLIELNAQKNAVELFMHLISVFSFVFGLNVIFSVFYFSGDIESLLPLPIKPYKIIASKFTAALINESMMEFIVILAAFAGYIIASGVPFWSWIIAVFGMLTMPIIPLAYCAVICMVLMLITKFIKSKDIINKITGLLTGLVVLALIIGISSIGGFDTEHLTQSISNPSNPILTVMNCIFPHIQFLVNSMSEMTLLNLLIYILINIAAIGLFMIIAQAIYIRTVLNMGRSTIKKHTSDKSVIEKLKVHSLSYSYLKKEFKLLIRTPAYFMNCIMINLMWPIFLYLIIVLQGQTNFLDSFVYGIRSGDQLNVLIFVLAVSVISVLVTAANSIASSAFTREGSHFSFIKYIPVSYMTQINIKASVSIIISGTGMVIYVIIAGLLLGLGLKFMIFCCIVALLSVTFTSYFGIFMDSINPKLIWDDELNALRGNYYIFFNMAVAIILEALICAGSYLLFTFTQMGALMIIIIIFVMLMLLNAISYLLCHFKATKNIEQL